MNLMSWFKRSIADAVDLEEALNEASAIGVDIDMAVVVDRFRESWEPGLTLANIIRKEVAAALTPGDTK